MNNIPSNRGGVGSLRPALHEQERHGKEGGTPVGWLDSARRYGVGVYLIGAAMCVGRLQAGSAGAGCCYLYPRDASIITYGCTHVGLYRVLIVVYIACAGLPWRAKPGIVDFALFYGRGV